MSAEPPDVSRIEAQDVPPVPPADRRCGFIALLGAPNAGKSTLLNRIVGAKVSIVSPKVQTTRTRVRGIVMMQAAQLVFIDTPGIFAPKRRLDRAMVRAAWEGAADADAVALLVDAAAGLTDEVRAIVDRLARGGYEPILVLNKTDRVGDKQTLLALSREFWSFGIFSEVFMISASRGSGVHDLVDFLAGKLPRGPWMFPEDDISDMPMRLLAAEITREKLYVQLRQELPYAATVETDEWEERADGSVRIAQTVYVERTGQKAIVLGGGGARIKRLGSAARTELCGIFDREVHLFLSVEVRENWGDDPNRFAVWGLAHDV